MRECGTCSMCCKVLEIDKPEEDIVKPADVWCKFCKPGKGCQVYELRPPVCQEFKCMWLLADFLPDGMRPDRSKALFQETGSEVGITCTLDAPDAHKDPEVAAVLMSIAGVQKFVCVIYKCVLTHIYYIDPFDLGKRTVHVATYARYHEKRKQGRLPGLPSFARYANVKEEA